MYNTETVNNGNMNEGRRTNGNARNGVMRMVHNKYTAKLEKAWITKPIKWITEDRRGVMKRWMSSMSWKRLNITV